MSCTYSPVGYGGGREGGGGRGGEGGGGRGGWEKDSRVKPSSQYDADLAVMSGASVSGVYECSGRPFTIQRSANDAEHKNNKIKYINKNINK